MQRFFDKLINNGSKLGTKFRNVKRISSKVRGKIGTKVLIKKGKKGIKMRKNGLMRYKTKLKRGQNENKVKQVGFPTQARGVF